MRKGILTEGKDKWSYRETKILSLVTGHPNVIEFYGLIEPEEEGKMPDFLFEFIETKDKQALLRKGEYSINNLINKTSYFHDLKTVRQFMWDLLHGLDHIHSKGVMHRDIKPSNIMINSEGQVKIIDFDLAEFLASAPHELNYTLAYKVATPGYKAPEVMLKQKKYDYRFDTYSAGCILAGILFRKAPFFDVIEGDEQWHSTVLVRGVAALKELDYRKKIKKPYRERWGYIKPWDLFEDFKQQNIVDKNLLPEYEIAFDMMELMLTLNYEQRPSVSDLFDHPFFTPLNFMNHDEL